MVHVAQAAGSGSDVLDDAVQSLEDRVGAPVVEIREDVLPVTTDPAGEGFHGFRTGVHHPRAPCPEPGSGLHPARAGGVDVLEGLAHPAGASGLDPLFLQVMPGLQLEPGQALLVAQPRVFRAPEQGVAPGPRLADLVDGLVGVLDHMELVDHLGGVGQVSADALGEPRAHVAGDQCHPVRVTVVVHEIQREPFDGIRVPAGHHADHVAFRRIGDHGDVPVAFAAGPVDADRLHARVILVQAGLVHIMSDEPPRSRVMFADLPGYVRDRLAFRRLHDHRLEQQREPAAWTGPRHRHRTHAVLGA